MIPIPPYLKPGDTVGITCPSGYLAKEKAHYAVRTLNDWGYQVIQGKTLGTGHHYYSGNDEARLQDLQYMLDHPEVKAILMGRGGYGLSRIIDRIDFTAFCNSPKWICGFSDISVLHSHIQAQYGIPTLHSPMCAAFMESTAQRGDIRSLQQAWTGQKIAYPVPPHPQNIAGTARGLLTGGNLAILAHLSGSRSQTATEGKILFLEDVGEYLYNIDRMLINLRRSGMLEGLAGLVCGGFTDLKDTTRPLGQQLIEIVLEKVENYGYPVCFDFPSGHLDVNYTLRLGMNHELTVAAEKVTLACLALPD